MNVISCDIYVQSVVHIDSVLDQQFLTSLPSTLAANLETLAPNFQVHQEIFGCSESESQKPWGPQWSLGRISLLDIHLLTGSIPMINEMTGA